MPPRYLKRKYSTRLKPCQERTVTACDTVPADGCCGVIPCKLCLEWQVYMEDSQYGSAEFDTSSWVGTLAGMSFVAYWERNHDDECEFVVELDGEEVYRATCYEGASCRNPGGEVDVSTEYIEGTLIWSTFEPRELHVVVDPDTGCNDFFCGECRCSCECLCVTISEYGGDIITGELCDVAYFCDAPTWAGTIGYYDLSLTLGRDQYGECILTPTVDGVELEPVDAAGCGSMSATFTDEAGNVFEVTCKECACVPSNEPCCPDRQVWPSQLTIEIFDPSPEGCYDLSGTLNELDPDAHSYGGSLSGTCTWCLQTFDIAFSVILTCNAESGWLVQFGVATPADDCGRVPPDAVLTQVSCDPILLSGDVDCFQCALMNCMTPDPPNPPMSVPHDPFCLSILISESP